MEYWKPLKAVTDNEKERERKYLAERSRLLALTDVQAEQEPLSARYSRIRYLRELEGQKMLEGHRNSLGPIVAKGSKRHFGGDD